MSNGNRTAGVESNWVCNHTNDNKIGRPRMFVLDSATDAAPQLWKLNLLFALFKGPRSLTCKQLHLLGGDC